MYQTPAYLSHFGISGSDPLYAQVWVHFDPASLYLSRIVELLENFGGDPVEIQLLSSTQEKMKVAWFKLNNQDVGHIVIGLIENLGLEAHGCGPASDKVQ